MYRLYGLLIIAALSCTSHSFADGEPNPNAPTNHLEGHAETLCHCDADLLKKVEKDGIDHQLTAKVEIVATADSEAMKKHIQRVKTRLLNRIRASTCSIRNEDNEDSDGADSDRDMGPSGFGGPGSRDEADAPSPGKGIQNMNVRDLMAAESIPKDLEFMDDLQDAIDAKEQQCVKEREKEKKRVKKTTTTPTFASSIHQTQSRPQMSYANSAMPSNWGFSGQPNFNNNNATQFNPYAMMMPSQTPYLSYYGGNNMNTIGGFSSQSLPMYTNSYMGGLSSGPFSNSSNYASIFGNSASPFTTNTSYLGYGNSYSANPYQGQSPFSSSIRPSSGGIILRSGLRY